MTDRFGKEMMAVTMQQQRAEIERAIDRVKQGKRSKQDAWLRHLWYKAGAQRKKCSPWHRQRVSGACGHGGGKDEHP